MIEKIYDINGAYDLFKSYNGLGNENCIFYMVTEDPIDLKTIAKGVMFGVALNAVGTQVIGVQQTEDTNNTSHFSGYLVNQTENGIGLIPLENEHLTDAINHMKIVPNSYMFINQKDIKNIKIEQKLIHFLNPSIRIITFEFFNGQKAIFRVYGKNKYVKYQENNFTNFMNHYGFFKNEKSNLMRNVAKVIFFGILLTILAIVIIGVVTAIKNSTNSNDSNSTNKVPIVDTKKIDVNKVNP